MLNGSFETTSGLNSVNDPIPTAWVVESGEPGSITAFSPPDGVRTGYIWGIGVGQPGVWSQKVSVVPGHTYWLTFYSGTHEPAVLPKVEMRFYNGADIEMGVPAIHLITTDLDITTALGGPYLLSAAAPAGASYLKVIFRDPSTNRVGAKGDAVCLIATAPTPTPSITATFTITSTPSQTPTQTSSPTISVTPSHSATASPTQTETQTPTRTSSHSPTATPTRTPTVLDFGDASDPSYPTLLSNNGASHALGTNIFLGACVDGEADGNASVAADGDDSLSGGTTFGVCSNPGDDDDGVVFPLLFVAGESVLIDISTNAACLLSAWVDWDQNGDWNGAGEQVFSSQLLTAGLNNFFVAVPLNASTGNTAARFRCSTQPNLTVSGPAVDGEVEDYMIGAIVQPTPTATAIASDTATPLPTLSPTDTATPTSTTPPVPTPTFTDTSTPAATPTPVSGCLPTPLGAAQGTNVFVLGDAYLRSSDVQGRMVVCGNASLQSYSVGSALIGLQDALKVNGNLTYTSGTIYGNAMVAGAASLSNVTLANGGTVLGASVPECVTAQSELTGLSTQFCALQANGQVSFQYGVLNLNGNNPLTNVFHITSAQLATANTLRIHVPPGSSALVNVSGGSATWQHMGIFLEGIDASRVLSNFCNATNLSIAGIAIPGSVLAPQASVQFNNGNIDGTLVAASLDGYGESHSVAFTGCVGPQPPI